MKGALRLSTRAAALAVVLAFAICSLATAAFADCPPGVIETVAGSGPCFSGDGGPATEARLDSPSGLALDRDGNLYIADTRNSRIRKVTRDGVITTMAGIWRWGDEGDGGPAEKAGLWTPSGVAFDSDGSLYIADRHNARIRKIDPAGIITTIAGTGERGISGDGGPALQARFRSACAVAVAPDGAVYVGSYRDPRIRRIGTDGIITSVAGTAESGFSGDGGPATAARLSEVWGMVVAPDGSLYFSDRGNNRVRKIDPAGVIITIAGDGWKDEHGNTRSAGDGGPAAKASLASPHGLALAADGSLYIADSGNGLLRRIDPAGIITTIAGGGKPDHVGDGGPAIEAYLADPVAVALGADGTIYISDEAANRVRKVDAAGIITTIAGSGAQRYSGDGGAAIEATLYAPHGLAFGPDGSLYITDAGNSRVRKVGGNGIITTVAGGGGGQDGARAVEADIGYVRGIAFGADGSLYVTTASHKVRKVGPDGIITTFAGDGEARHAGDGGPASQASLNYPSGLLLAPDGTVYIADENNHRIRKVDPAGIITTFAGDGEARYAGDGGPASQASLRDPFGLLLAPDGSLYIADTGNSRVRKVSPDGVITTIAGTGEAGSDGDGGPATKARLGMPRGLALGHDGGLYIADPAELCIRKVGADGIITTVAGSGVRSYWGDGGPATEAAFHRADDIALAPDGSLYISDMLNHRVRRVRWRPCDPAQAKAAADAGRAKAADSPDAWREVTELYLIAKDWEDALAAGQRVVALTPERDEPAHMRAEVLVARVYAEQGDLREARRRLIPILGRAKDPRALGEAAGGLADLYLHRGERTQAVAILSDLEQRTQDPHLQGWLRFRLKRLAAD